MGHVINLTLRPFVIFVSGLSQALKYVFFARKLFLIVKDVYAAFLRESVAYPVLITAETPPPPPPPRISTGGRAQMGGFKGCSKNFRV